MLSVNIQIEAVVQQLQGIKQRLENRHLFFRNVVRPRLLDEFAAVYREAGVRVQTGRLLESYISLTHAEHISEVGKGGIIEGSRVPYAIFVERLLPVAGRVGRNHGLINEFTQNLGAFITDGD